LEPRLVAIFHGVEGSVLGLLVVAALVAAACGGPSAPASPDFATIVPVEASRGVGEGRPSGPLRAGRTGPVQNVSFERISVEHGLSHSTVNCILQDSKGFMWFGTDDGLNKYDGYSFTVYKHNPLDRRSLSHNQVWSLFEDSSGVLWVGTYGGGLNRFDRDSGRFTHYDADDFQNVTDEPEEFRNVIEAIGEHPTGVLWIATYGGGLVKFDLDLETFTSYAPDPADARFGGHEWISGLLVDRSGKVWIGTHSEGLDRFDPTTGQITSYRHDPNDPDGLGHDWITDIVQDRSGQIWIATYGGGLERFDPKTERFTHYRHDPADPRSLSDNYVWSIVEDASGVLWIGTYSGGLDAFDPKSETFTHFHHDATDPHSLSSDRIRSIYQSQSGVLWVGTRGGGVSKSDPASGRFTHYRGDSDDPQRPSDYQVLALHEDEQGVLWIGTAGGGLDGLDRETGEWHHYRRDPADPNSLGNDTVLAIHEDSSGTLWIGTDEGFYRFDWQAERFGRMDHNPPDPGDVKRETIYSIDEDQAGVLWLGTHGRGLSEFDPATGAFTYHQHGWDPETGMPEQHTLSSNFVRDVFEDAWGRLWVGTQDGLNIFDRDTGQWHSLQHNPDEPHSLSHDWVMSLYGDQSGMLWVGTQGGGLSRLVLSADGTSVVKGFDPATWTFTHYREQDGLANDTVRDMLEHAPPSGGVGTVWIGTANGLSRFDPRTETFTSYDASDGLPINEFSTACTSSSGELLFGGVNGFISFYPDRMEPNPYVPPVVLTSLQQNGKEVDADQAPEDLREVTLRWPDNSFEFGFAALNYTQPEKNRHAYVLEGFDEGWNTIGTRRFGRYTNLPGGTYTLRLRGSNNDGVWNEAGASIRVTIVPPFWQTWWFRATVVLVLVAGAAGGYRLRVRNLEARSRELERQVEGRTAELRREIVQRTQAEEALRQREREQAITEERNRLARELHDSVTQALYGVTLYAEAAAGHLALGHRDRAAEHLEELQDTAQEALAEMRLLIFELRPPILEELGLAAALQARLQAVEGRAGLRTEFKTNVEEGQPKMPPDVEEGLYRIALEALNNALKHAQARNIKVHLRQDERTRAEPVRVTLEIADDGIGFDLATARERGGVGLSAMEERAAALGGRLTVESAPGTGTSVQVSVVTDGELGGSRGKSEEVVGARGSSEEVVGARRRSWELGGSRGSSWELVGARRKSWELVGARRSSGELGGARGNSEEVVGARGNS
jgi:signal transduction histidine kinase/ligand-binding sensor domain-containing protein